jgi:phosphoglycerol transferase MdoB-like AlkP superfamily enzyme
MLVALPILNSFKHDLVLAFSVPVLALVFCIGLFYFNYRLYKKTKADTPWKGAIAATLFIAIAFVLSLIGR